VIRAYPLNTTDANCSASCNEGADNCTSADPNGTACADGLFCNGTDTCTGGTCATHTGDPCLPLVLTDANCAASCNEGADNCTAADPNGTVCTDSLFCTGTDSCTAGACTTHTGDPCLPLNLTDAKLLGVVQRGRGQLHRSGCERHDVRGRLVLQRHRHVHGRNLLDAHRRPVPGPDGDNNCAETCDESADNCNANDANGSACNDGLFCNGTDTCTTGTCSTHTGDPCPGPGRRRQLLGVVQRSGRQLRRTGFRRLDVRRRHLLQRQRLLQRRHVLDAHRRSVHRP
jgi:hypothetical protein